VDIRRFSPIIAIQYCCPRICHAIFQKQPDGSCGNGPVYRTVLDEEASALPGMLRSTLSMVCEMSGLEAGVYKLFELAGW
jgi:hypothetical protein